LRPAWSSRTSSTPPVFARGTGVVRTGARTRRYPGRRSSRRQLELGVHFVDFALDHRQLGLLRFELSLEQGGAFNVLLLVPLRDATVSASLIDAAVAFGA
jgi:hypothetical protein